MDQGPPVSAGLFHFRRTNRPPDRMLARPITHKTMALWLNPRRATVIVALQELEGGRAIWFNRARIELRYQTRLKQLAAKQ